MNSTLCVPISSEIVAQFLLRKPKADLTQWIENILTDYLDRTEDDPKWSDAYRQYLAAEADIAQLSETIGDPVRGFWWKNLLLPNGTKIRMTYKGRTHMAEVLNDQIMYAGRACSPGELASRIAENTNRNAWRDLYIKRPRDSDFTLASVLRETRK